MQSDGQVTLPIDLGSHTDELLDLISQRKLRDYGTQFPADPPFYNLSADGRDKLINAPYADLVKMFDELYLDLWEISEGMLDGLNEKDKSLLRELIRKREKVRTYFDLIKDMIGMAVGSFSLRLQNVEKKIAKTKAAPKLDHAGMTFAGATAVAFSAAGFAGPLAPAANLAANLLAFGLANAKESMATLESDRKTWMSDQAEVTMNGLREMVADLQPNWWDSAIEIEHTIVSNLVQLDNLTQSELLKRTDGVGEKVKLIVRNWERVVVREAILPAGVFVLQKGDEQLRGSIEVPQVISSIKETGWWKVYAPDIWEMMNSQEGIKDAIDMARESNRALGYVLTVRINGVDRANLVLKAGSWDWVVYDLVIGQPTEDENGEFAGDTARPDVGDWLFAQQPPVGDDADPLFTPRQVWDNGIAAGEDLMEDIRAYRNKAVGTFSTVKDGFYYNERNQYTGQIAWIYSEEGTSRGINDHYQAMVVGHF